MGDRTDLQKECRRKVMFNFGDLMKKLQDKVNKEERQKTLRSFEEIEAKFIQLEEDLKRLDANVRQGGTVSNATEGPGL